MLDSALSLFNWNIIYIYVYRHTYNINTFMTQIQFFPFLSTIQTLSCTIPYFPLNTWPLFSLIFILCIDSYLHIFPIYLFYIYIFLSKNVSVHITLLVICL